MRVPAPIFFISAFFGLACCGFFALARRNKGALRVVAGLLMAVCGLLALLSGICGYILVNHQW